MPHPESPWERAMRFFTSLRLTIVLLIIMSVVSIIGTVIPQGDLSQEYLHGISQTKFKMYQALGLFDMYHSWWFITLLALFTINLIVCSVKRLPYAWRYVTHPSAILDKPLIAGLTNRVVIPLEGRPISCERLQDLMGKALGTVTVTEADGAVHLFSERNSTSRLAVYVTHLSIVIIFAGSIIGSLFGYKGYVSIPEGGIVSTVETRDGRKMDLGFSLRCEEFDVSHYPNGAPKEFKSVLTVVGKQGEAVPGFTRVPVIVNDPLTYKGITFYQSSYGTTGDHSFTVAGADGKVTDTVVVPSHGAGRLPDGSIIRVAESTPDVSLYIPGKRGAAAQIDILSADGGEKRTTVVFADHPEENLRDALRSGGPVIGYSGVSGQREYTGLQVTKDPGVWVVWIGCILLILGIYGAFLMSHRRMWIKITDTAITVAGHANKNQAAFETTFEQFADAVRTHLSGEADKL
ncbi:cytochrome c biogenesis protein ResB [Geobacter sp. DSM 9736]|uniref:cytochrome c biogenesis protein ResB n=1 Tax=Geobacter sp. DSM 9736 TaxID=1277350 RepID=UPI000B508B9F|nr:cytochrome c biogenesis protein ResB [Geobacter sp. DSM 9736]SNB46234.1 cytochrome c biogenesis protein [Geobacter sp. DSM 9736]